MSNESMDSVIRRTIVGFFTFRYLQSRHILLKSVFFGVFSTIVGVILSIILTDKREWYPPELFFDVLVRGFLYYNFESGWELIHKKT